MRRMFAVPLSSCSLSHQPHHSSDIARMADDADRAVARPDPGGSPGPAGPPYPREPGYPAAQ